MKRFLVFLAAAGAAAYWWLRRSPAAADTPSVPPIDEPPKLGGDVDADLLAILACPVDKEPVSRQGHYLVCSACQRHYPIRDGIPVMLIDEALTPEQAAAQTA